MPYTYEHFLQTRECTPGFIADYGLDPMSYYFAKVENPTDEQWRNLLNQLYKFDENHFKELHKCIVKNDIKGFLEILGEDFTWVKGIWMMI